MTKRDLLIAVMNQILRQPETWTQSVWNCGSSHCFGGWCIVKTKVKTNLGRFAAAKKLLRLDFYEAAWLFHADRTLDDLYQYVKVRVKHHRKGRDPEGFDAFGLQPDGSRRMVPQPMTRF